MASEMNQQFRRGMEESDTAHPSEVNPRILNTNQPRP